MLPQRSLTFTQLVFFLAPCALGRVGHIEGPWIGILGVPASVSCDTLGARPPAPGQVPVGGSSCFTDLYDKWLQSAGARTVGIPYDAYDTNRTALDALLSSLNGVLFTGGGLNLLDMSSPYYQTGRYIFEWVKRENDQGRFFPLTGHCMGFQFLAILAAGDNSSVLLRNAYDSEGLSLPLLVTAEANESLWLSRMPPAVLHTFTRENSTTNLHHDGVSPASFYGSARLSGFFRIVSTNRDRKGRDFVSTIEAKRYPILAVQWHPERNPFEWTPELHINHSPSAVAANMWTAVDFIAQGRQCPVRERDLALLSRFTTYSMRRVPAGRNVLDGLTELQFDGFGSSSAQHFV